MNLDEWINATKEPSQPPEREPGVDDNRLDNETWIAWCRRLVRRIGREPKWKRGNSDQ